MEAKYLIFKLKANMECSFYKNVIDKKGVVVPVISVLSAIRDGKWESVIQEIRITQDKKLRDKKKQSLLPAATFSGVFSKREDSCIKKYTRLVTIDIDQKDKAKKVKSMMMQDPYVFSCFMSPSGGLKALYIVDVPGKYHRNFSYPQIKEFVQDNYNVEVDKSGSNISRLCFVSYDPEIYINKDASIFSIDTRNRYNDSGSSTEFVVPDNYEPSSSLNEIYEICNKWTQKHYSFRKGSRNNFCHMMACHLNRAGVSERDAVNLILSGRNVEKNFVSTIKGVYRRNSSEHGSRPILVQKKSNINELI